MEQDNRIITCKARRLTVPAPLMGHKAYLQALAKLAEVSGTLARSPSANPGESAQRIKHLLAALVVHLVGPPCPECAAAVELGTMLPEERRFNEARRAYQDSEHAQKSSSLMRICIDLPVEDASSGEEGAVFPLPVAAILLVDRYAKPSAADQPTGPALAAT